MRRIQVRSGDRRELSLVEFLRAGDSFRICSEAHRWPPLPTFIAFLQCGYDDVGDDVMEWRPFHVEAGDYDAARTAVDPDGVIDSLGVNTGDWSGWFLAAVAILRPD